MADTSLTPVDRTLSEMPKIVVPQGGGEATIPLQFPPRVTADTKSSKWHVKDTKAYEPYKQYFGAESAALTLELEYIATDSDFTPRKISQITKTIKGYFYYSDVKSASEVYPAIKITDLYGWVVGTAYFRLMNFSTSFGETLIYEAGGTAGNVWPLYTKIILNLELATQIAPVSGEGDPYQAIKPLPIRAQFSWW